MHLGGAACQAAFQVGVQSAVREDNEAVSFLEGQGRCAGVEEAAAAGLIGKGFDAWSREGLEDIRARHVAIVRVTVLREAACPTPEEGGAFETDDSGWTTMQTWRPETKLRYSCESDRCVRAKVVIRQYRSLSERLLLLRCEHGSLVVRTLDAFELYSI